MPQSSWQLGLLSGRISVIKHDSLSVLAHSSSSLKVSLPPLQITHSIHSGSLYPSRVNCAVDSPWRKHKPDMTETSPWLWLVATNWATETASESLRDVLRWCYTHQTQRQLRWIGFVSVFFFFQPQLILPVQWIEWLIELFSSLIFVQMN